MIKQKLLIKLKDELKSTQTFSEEYIEKTIQRLKDFKYEGYDYLYDYQEEAVYKSLFVNKGIICLPTGTGKTRVLSSMIAYDILKNPEPLVYVINAPRILLTYQLLEEVCKLLFNLNIDCKYGFVHSGKINGYDEVDDIRRMANIGFDIKISHSDVKSGTSVDDIINMINDAKTFNSHACPCILFSTYHSVNRIELARLKQDFKISMILNDESHNLVQTRFHENLKYLKSDKRYFFTATPESTESDEGMGMNNVSVYGETFFLMTPRTAIDIGKMIKPRIHMIRSISGISSEDDYIKSIPKLIYESFYAHKKCLVDTFYENTERDLLTPKLLVCTGGSRDGKNFLSSIYIDYLIKNGITVFTAFSNSLVGIKINKKVVKREEFLTKMKEYGEDKTKPMLVLHYSILSEGIDVSGFTGVLFLRTVGFSEAKQIIGRIARVYSKDKNMLNINPKTNILNLSKPFAYVMLPIISKENVDASAKMVKLINKIRYEYGISVDEIIKTTDARGIPEIDELPGMETKKKLVLNGKEIDMMFSEIENIQKANLEIDEGENIYSIHNLKEVNEANFNINLEDARKREAVEKDINVRKSITRHLDFVKYKMFKTIG